MALKYGLTIYDASYVALAEYLDGPVVYTADAKFVEKVNDPTLVIRFQNTVDKFYPNFEIALEIDCLFD